MNKHIGSSLDDFLAEDSSLEEVTAAAQKRVLVYQVTQAMQKMSLTQTALAERMNTSRTTVRRLLDEKDTGVTLATLVRASVALDKPLTVRLGRNLRIT